MLEQVQTNGKKTPEQAVEDCVAALTEEYGDIRARFEVRPHAAFLPRLNMHSRMQHSALFQKDMPGKCAVSESVTTPLQEEVQQKRMMY